MISTPMQSSKGVRNILEVRCQGICLSTQLRNPFLRLGWNSVMLIWGAELTSHLDPQLYLYVAWPHLFERGCWPEWRRSVKLSGLVPFVLMNGFHSFIVKVPQHCSFWKVRPWLQWAGSFDTHPTLVSHRFLSGILRAPALHTQVPISLLLHQGK